MAEKGRASVMDGIPAALPALAYAAKVQKKAASQGVDWRTLLGVEPGSLAARLLELVDDARAAASIPRPSCGPRPPACETPSSLAPPDLSSGSCIQDGVSARREEQPQLPRRNPVMRKLWLAPAILALVALGVAAPAASAQEGNATVVVVHGIPDTDVDVYVNDELTLDDFTFETVTDPLSLPAGDYDLAVRAADADRVRGSAPRGDATLTAGANVIVIAHLTEAGEPTLTPFVNDTAHDGRRPGPPRRAPHRGRPGGRRARRWRAGLHRPHQPERGQGRPARRHRLRRRSRSPAPPTR